MLDPVKFEERDLYFRGRYIVDALIDDLKERWWVEEHYWVEIWDATLS